MGSDIVGDGSEQWFGWEVAMDASGHTIAVTSLGFKLYSEKTISPIVLYILIEVPNVFSV